MRNENGQFVKGQSAPNRLPVGSIRIRTRHKRGGEQRAFIKTEEPNTWTLLARHIWEKENGTIPSEHGIHHIDGDKLNDDISNLKLVSKSEHLAIHREEYSDRSIAALVAARRKIRWSTKSKTKRTGRPPSWNEKDMEDAINAYLSSSRTYVDVANEFNVTASALGKRVRKIKT